VAVSNSYITDCRC